MSAPILTLTWTKDGDQVTKNVTISGGGGSDGVNGVTMAIGTNVAVNNAIDTSQLKALYIHSTTDCTLAPNSSGSPTFTALSLTGGSPLVWYLGCGLPNPISADVTKWYVTNAAETVLDIRTDQDPTP